MKRSNRMLIGIACALAFGATGAFASTPTAHPAKPMHAKSAAKCGYRHWTTKQLASLQQVLNAKGFKPDTKVCWDHQTRAAVTAFQKKNGLKATGFPNKKTRKALGLGW